MTEQRAIYDAVAQRGYRYGWTAEQFAARQVCKLSEELCELNAGFCLPEEYWRTLAPGSRYVFAGLFDDKAKWLEEPEGLEDCDIESAKDELADLQVVVMCLAEALGEICGEPFDVVRAALDKATADVERGVREDGR